MMQIKTLSFYIILLYIAACNKKEKSGNSAGEISTADSVETIEASETRDAPAVNEEIVDVYAQVHDTAFVVMNKFASGFAYDMKYATNDNFLNKKVYTCDDCLLRKEVAEALKEANNSLRMRRLRIKFFDCYRPVDVQKQMWKIYPDARYVANPYGSGSIHNRGGAVDITLENFEGEELDMGTGFDHFGREAHHAYANLSDTILSNRKLLKSTMEAHGFKAITSEWWHYGYNSATKYGLSNFSVECD